jgi:hypothetical protein
VRVRQAGCAGRQNEARGDGGIGLGYLAAAGQGGGGDSDAVG